jgi:hyperosmotically inducible periplasmic protein
MSARRRLLASMVVALTLTGPLACGRSEEAAAPVTAKQASERLAAARQEVDALRQKVAEAKVAQETAEKRSQEAEAALDQARESYEQARNALRDGEQKLASLEPPPPSDEQIFRQVQKRLLDAPALAKVAIQAEVKDRAVILHGTVPDESTRDAAVSIARGVDGVTGVDSQIEIVD